MRTFCLLSLLAGMAGCTSTSSEPTPSVEPEPSAMAPLAGSWVAEAFGGEIHESWVPGPEGSLQKSEGYFVADGDTSYSEVVNIGPIGETTYLVAHPSTGGVMVWEQTAVSEAGATFENANNANPARIDYAYTS
ncbi:MAG: DUF6265 family protein, partial [Bacteroidota bacterium]